MAQVCGQPVPTLLLDLISTNRWVHPGDDVMRKAVPFIHEPLKFLSSLEHMERESGGHPADADEWMHEYHSRRSEPPRDLPWLDADLAFFVAINACIGDDLAIALDYRVSDTDPRVVATDWTNDGCLWRLVTDSLPEFVEMIGL